MDSETVIARNEDIVAREVGGETVLLDLQGGTYYGLNEVGGRIWAMLETDSHSIAAICDVLETEFDAARGELEADVKALTADLKENGLVSLTG
ncbi:PqqD family protein [Aurantiacibacter gangjinensis]|uniref:Thymidylate synthase n=1 Tax=Aurantiacibacter gangjinensis TaxID=502682 RepID=A0A0G9ML57_9SPHN|nr:PqqD family protein [Aurantiacibacter gangjinensis]KLE31425.1 hypothetical protein AAW01_07470 [Aurantiacibacter gangjinensis]